MERPKGVNRNHPNYPENRPVATPQPVSQPLEFGGGSHVPAGMGRLLKNWEKRARDKARLKARKKEFYKDPAAFMKKYQLEKFDKDGNRISK